MRWQTSKSRNWLIALFLVLAGTAGWWLTRDEQQAAEDQPLLARVETGSIENTIASSGTIKPSHYVDVGAQVSGMLQKLRVDVGDVVTQGQLLAEIDARVQEAKVQASRASIAAQEAQLIARRAALELGKANADRQQRLRAADATSALEYDTAMNNLAAAQSSLEQLQKQIDQSKATLTSDETQLEFASIFAPVAGTVVSIELNEGRTLNAAQQAPTILRIRLRASLMWLTQFRCHIDHELDFRLALHMFADTYPTLFTSDPPAALLPWPLVLNPLLCIRLVWHAYAQLRALVYAEFARFRGPHPELKLLAAQHFVASMLRTPNAHKTDQLLAALQTAYSLPCFHRTQPSAEWIRFWAERPPCSDSDVGRRAVAGLKAIARIDHAARSLACTPGRANPFCVWHLQPNGTSRFVRLFHSNTHYRTRYEFWRSQTEGEMLQTLIDSGVMRCLDDVDAFLSNANWFLVRNRNPTPPPSEW